VTSEASVAEVELSPAHPATRTVAAANAVNTLPHRTSDDRVIRSFFRSETA